MAAWVERARPLLGTLVRIGVRGVDDAAAHAAIERGFEAVAAIHRLMSFHQPDSDVSRLNRLAARCPGAAARAVPIDRRTGEVLALAREVSAVSDGVFDVTVAPRLVTDGWLPRPAGAPEPDPGATWQDVELVAPDRVRFRRPLWIDLGGIAKGYAVDAAMAALDLGPAASCRVNAGGDLRVAGPAPERVLLDVPGHPPGRLPAVDLLDGSLASSTPLRAPTCDPARRDAPAAGPHLHGRDRRPAGADRFASVVAPRCAIADALTKVVLAEGDDAAMVLDAFGATAYLYDRRSGWRTLGGPE